MRHRSIDDVAAGRVQDAFRLTGGTRRVQDEQGILGAHFLAGAIRVDFGFELVQPVITALDPIDIAPGVLNDQHFFQRRHIRILRRGIDVRL